MSEVYKVYVQVERCVGPDGDYENIHDVDVAQFDTEDEAVACAESVPDLRACLRDLLNWGREHTCPIEPNSPHALLVRAHELLYGKEARAS